MDESVLFDFSPGRLPLLISFPHAGTDIAPALEARFTPVALARRDTDWHLPRLYAFARDWGASWLAARVSRYVIDLNRPPEDVSLYPGQDTTGLCPLDTFRKEPLYRPGQAPQADEVAERRERFWQPYHRRLQAELERLVAVHGVAVLWEAHSIASVLPRFFAGKLPDLNLGTADGRSCGPDVEEAVVAVLRDQTEYTWVANGRFKGGYITRHYGRPAEGVHALQMEMCQCTYMREAAPFAYVEGEAERVRAVLGRMLRAVVDG